MINIMSNDKVGYCLFMKSIFESLLKRCLEVYSGKVGRNILGKALMQMRDSGSDCSVMEIMSNAGA